MRPAALRHGTGEDYGPAPNIDHTQDWVRNDLKVGGAVIISNPVYFTP
jgi:hypothetical protein